MREDECRALLDDLLDSSGVPHERYGPWTRFRLCEGRMVWETACRCRQDEILIYSRYPLRAADTAAALAACDRANGALIRGAMFLADGVPTYRIRADLRDPYGARGRLAQAIEYSAAAVTHFWGGMQAACRPD